jgi:hypothetical protein
MVSGAHAAAFIVSIPAWHRLYVWLGSATEGDDSFPYIIYLDRCLIEPGIPFSLHLQAQGMNRVLNLYRHDSIPKLPHSKLAEQR